MSPCYEIVSYDVSDPAQADAARAAARTLIAAFPGFLSWTEFVGAREPTRRTDLVAWRSEAEAMTAARSVGEDPEFADFRASVVRVQSIDHYHVAQLGLAPQGEGLELGRFRLKNGVEEGEMRHAHQRMVQNHLSRQPGWLRQNLVALGEGRFIDMAFAVDQQHAEDICAGWAANADCDAFLALVDCEDMTFGTVT